MVLTPWAEATGIAWRAVHDARAVLQPSTETFSAQNLARLSHHQGKRWFCGGVWACAYSSGLPTQRRTICIRFAPKPEKRRAYLREGLVDLGLAFRVIWGQKYGCNDCLRIGLLASSVRGTRAGPKQAEIGVSDYVAWGHVVASPGRVARIR